MERSEGIIIGEGKEWVLADLYFEGEYDPWQVRIPLKYFPGKPPKIGEEFSCEIYRENSTTIHIKRHPLIQEDAFERPEDLEKWAQDLDV